MSVSIDDYYMQIAIVPGPCINRGTYMVMGENGLWKTAGLIAQTSRRTPIYPLENFVPESAEVRHGKVITTRPPEVYERESNPDFLRHFEPRQTVEMSAYELFMNETPALSDMGLHQGPQARDVAVFVEGMIQGIRLADGERMKLDKEDLHNFVLNYVQEKRRQEDDLKTMGHMGHFKHNA